MEKIIELFNILYLNDEDNDNIANNNKYKLPLRKRVIKNKRDNKKIKKRKVIYQKEDFPDEEDDELENW